MFLTQLLFSGFDERIIRYTNIVFKILIIFDTLLIFYALLDTWNDIFNRKPKSTYRSIKGYLQVTKIVLGFVGGIIIIATLLQKDPSSLFVGLGATAALFLLVFKDTILGFVASIQLSAQDMVRPGDWIEMPSKNADGVILDINVNSVKVQNWDNTITMIPIYSMVSESFTNWRGMEQSLGRRFVRTFNIDINSVVGVTDDLLSRLRSNVVTSSYYDDIMVLSRESSSEGMETNLSLFRSSIELYMRRSPLINSSLPSFVRYKFDTTDSGLPMEVYGFSGNKSMVSFDLTHRSVVEYVLASASIFDIIIYQKPSGNDVRGLVLNGGKASFVS